MNDCPFDTVNGAQFETAGSKTVSFPLVMTTATAEPCVCQPKLPPGLTVICSTTIAPAVALIVKGAFIVPTASAFATIGVPAPTEGPATTSAAAAARPSSASFMGSSFESSRSPRRAVTDTRRTVLAAPLHALSSGMPAAELHSSRRAGDGEHALGASDRRARVRVTADCEQDVRSGNDEA